MGFLINELFISELSSRTALFAMVRRSRRALYSSPV